MRRIIPSLILIGGIAAALPCSLASAQVLSKSPATQPDAAAAVPVKAIVLYSSGVGYFQHAGTVTGNATTVLRFKSGQINDILKSLVLEDKGGTVSAVTYPSLDPLTKTLHSFQVDISSNPPLDQLLNQLRGAKVTVTLTTEKIAGTILGVEQRTKPAGENKTYEVPVINLISDGNIRSVEMTELRDIQLDNPALQEELSRALTALAAARDQDKKPVTIHFTGNGQREVLLGYVVETPVWKTSYRLILGAAGGQKPATRPDQPGVVAGHLQGWAIVENQTDFDWNDVQLSLVSGRPISFVQDLSQPIYVPRPVVKPELFASLTPQTYEGGMDEKRDKAAKAAAAPGMAGDTDGDRAADATLGLKNGVAANRQLAEQMRGRAAGVGGGSFRGEADALQALDASRIQSVASAANLGDLFQYTVGSVSLPRQSSAMIPIVSSAIDVEKVDIFNQNVLARHPLNGARIKNTTGNHLLAGPVTVIDGSAYSGDAQINDVPPDQQRLLSYGIDLKMLVDVKGWNQTDDLLSGKIVKGVLTLTHKNTQSVTYEADNKDDRDRVLVIEHPITPNWDLFDTPNPVEKTDQLYRFQETVKPSVLAKFTVKQQMVSDQAFMILQSDPDQLLVAARRGPISDKVKDALQKAGDLKRAVADTTAKITQNAARDTAIVEDQKRINETLRTIGQNAQNNSLYARLSGKLNDQETELEKLRSERDDLTKQKNDQQKQLEDYLVNLNVE